MTVRNDGFLNGAGVQEIIKIINKKMNTWKENVLLQIKNGGTGATDSVSARRNLEGSSILFNEGEKSPASWWIDSSHPSKTITLSDSVLNYETIFFNFAPSSSGSTSNPSERFVCSRSRLDIREQLDCVGGKNWVIPLYAADGYRGSIGITFSNDGKSFTITYKELRGWANVHIRGVYGVGKVN